MTEDRFSKYDILSLPDLEPERSYESEGSAAAGKEYKYTKTPNKFLKTIDDLDNVYNMADLLPAELSAIIKRISNVLSIDSQGKMIIKMRDERNKKTPEDDKTNKPNNNDDGKYIINKADDNDGGNGIYNGDIFSATPQFSIEVEPSDSLVDIARSSFEDDDNDIKRYFTSQMTQLCARFFQIMTTLADESGMPDYSYLMYDFDGTAVTTDDENQRHLIDNIVKNQVLYDQKIRQMNLLHTAENTLIMTRAFNSAEAQRERYLGEKYKRNMPDMSSSFSNDILEAERSEANEKYKQTAYNMYKYLDSATKYTNELLNMKIDDASAKSQLSNTGSDIFAQTPPPTPVQDEIDDGYETTKKQTEAGKKYIKEQMKDSKKASELDNGMGSGSYGNGSDSGVLGGGNVEPAIVWKALRAAGYNEIATAAIMGNIQIESHFNTGADNGSHRGLAQWDYSGRWAALEDFAQSKNKDPMDGGTQIDFLVYEAENTRYPEECCPAKMNSFGSVEEATHQWLKYFEGALGQADTERAEAANLAYNQFKGSK